MTKIKGTLSSLVADDPPSSALTHDLSAIEIPSILLLACIQRLAKSSEIEVLGSIAVSITIKTVTR
jgi:hypothetical protein